MVLVDNQGSRSDAKRVSFDVAQAPVALGRQGVVTGIHEVTQQGDATGAGALVGGVLGGVLGHQVGGGHGNTAATVLGAVGGAVAGNLVEKNAGSKKSYQVAVRFNDGQNQVFNANGYPSLRAGDRVKVVNGILQADR